MTQKLSSNGFDSAKIRIKQKQIKICEKYIMQNLLPAKRPYKYQSYWFKHKVERSTERHADYFGDRWLTGTYISNGAFIQACLNLGFRVEPNGLNALIYCKFRKKRK